jgi:hypothetical protein
LVVVSGWFASGGFASGDVLQVMGQAINSGVGVFSLTFTSTQRTSG